MQPYSSAIARAEQPAQTHTYRKGARIYIAGGMGQAWQITAGAVRLDRSHSPGYQFAGLAFAGELIGLETWVTGHYGFSVSALIQTTLESWPAAHKQCDTTQPCNDLDLLHMYVQLEARTADLIALREGLAEDRICRLLTLLHRGQATDRIAIPNLKDVADITGLSVETASRIISRLRRSGLLGRRIRGVIQLAWPLPDTQRINK